MGKVIGNCSKHPGQNFVDCPLCEIDKMKRLAEQKYHAVEYAGFWNIQTGPFYGGTNILNAEDVGPEEARNNAALIVKLLNENAIKK